MTAAAAPAPSTSAAATAAALSARTTTAAWWRIAWYPVAPPIAFIVLIWSGSAIHPVWLVRPLALTIVFVVAVGLAFGAILRDRDRAGIATFAVTVGLIADDLRITALLAVFALLVVAEGLVHRGRPWRFGRIITRALSAFGVGFLIVTLVSVVQQGMLARAIDDVSRDLSGRAAGVAPAGAADIWVILLDGYPGDAAAADIAPWWDAEAFPAALTDRGFQVQRDTRSNYLQTRLTLAAVFADRHLVEIPQLQRDFPNDAVEAAEIRDVTDGGIVSSAVRDAGYDRVVISSGYSHLGLRRVERVIDTPQVNEFELVLLRGTGLGELIQAANPGWLASEARARVVDAYGAIAELAAEDHDRPRFVFAHVTAPHEPWVFDAEGNPTDGGPGTSAASFDAVRDDEEAGARRTYDYATDIGRRTEQAVDEILAASPTEPVIMVFSDHGTAVRFHPSAALESDLDERTSAFLAVRMPDGREVLPAGTTIINALPRVLNAQLGTDLPVNPDTLWSWATTESVLDLVDITTRIAEGWR